ncbi:MAG TPA: toll/interleukin-1 receptor domain-containing protein [Pyrinomonadaceae bacterium]|nr:toll/interleukin-1 receptor domain-containing protein [Pyrinomonadaceae bacterium]
MADQQQTSANAKRDWDFFLSHAGEDLSVASNLRLCLDPPAKVFLDAASLGPEDPWTQQLMSALQRSLIFVVLVSKHSSAAYYQSEEIVIANRMTAEDPYTRRVVPVYLDVTEVPLGPFGLNAREAICVPDSNQLDEVGPKLLSLLQTLKPLEAKKNKLVAEQRAALEKIGGQQGNKERLAGLHETTQLSRPLLNVLQVMLVVTFVAMIASLTLDSLAEVRVPVLAALGSVMALLLGAILYVYSLALKGAMQIAQGNINGG